VNIELASRLGTKEALPHVTYVSAAQCTSLNRTVLTRSQWAFGKIGKFGLAHVLGGANDAFLLTKSFSNASRVCLHEGFYGTIGS